MNQADKQYVAQEKVTDAVAEYLTKYRWEDSPVPEEDRTDIIYMIIHATPAPLWTKYLQ